MVQVLVPVELEPPTVGGDELHRVAHGRGLHLIRFGHHETERPRRHVDAIGRDGRCLDVAVERRRERRIGDCRVDVGNVDREHEGERRCDGFPVDQAGLERRRAEVEPAGHLLGEAQRGRRVGHLGLPSWTSGSRPVSPAAIFSASAAIVSDGLAPRATGTMAPSATYRPE